MPFDPRKPFDPSGIRIGTPAVTSRGMKKDAMEKIAAWIDQVVAAPADEGIIEKTAAEVRAYCKQFPAPGISI